MVFSAPIIISVVIFVAIWFVVFFKTDKRPYMIQAFFLGACYFLLASLVYRVIWKELNFSPDDKSSPLSVLIIAFFIAGFLEELARLSAVMTESIQKVDSIKDAVWYSFSASLGLALFENIFYAVKYDTIYLQIWRLLFPTTGHLTYGIILGFFIGKAKFSNNNLFILLGLIITTVVHSVYNILLNQPHLPKVFAFIPEGIALIIAVKILIDLRKEAGRVN